MRYMERFSILGRNKGLVFWEISVGLRRKYVNEGCNWSVLG